MRLTLKSLEDEAKKISPFFFIERRSGDHWYELWSTGEDSNEEPYIVMQADRLKTLKEALCTVTSENDQWEGCP